MTLIYVAHPLNGAPGPEANLERYYRICAAAMRDYGVTILSWGHHAEMVQRGICQQGTHREWLEHDVRLLLRADEVWFTEDPEMTNSIGLYVEWMAAGHHGRVRRIVEYDDKADTLAFLGFSAGRSPLPNFDRIEAAYAAKARGEPWRHLL